MSLPNSPEKRPTTVTFNVEYTRSSSNHERSLNSGSNENNNFRPPTKQSYSRIKTADLSHITDHKPINPLPSFIPREFSREMTTPIPFRPNTSVPDPESNQWKTQVFPSVEATNSRQEVENLGEWLNSVLEKNQKETKDPLELAKNARNWFTIAYDELCRQVSVECPERSKLLTSIWKRYQSLFGRVVQLHQEEKNYLVSMHKERTSSLKTELDQCQSKLKQISQQYRDDQERWSNSREREETKFANMRKKLDLQVKNKRSLLMQIRSLKEKLGQSSSDIVEDIQDDIKIEQQPEITVQMVSDRVLQLRHKIKTDNFNLIEATIVLEDISNLIDHEKLPPRSIRDISPSIFRELPSNYLPKIRSLKWTMSALTYFYSLHLSGLSSRQQPTTYSTNRLYFINFIFEHLISMYGTVTEAAETFFDLIETCRTLSNSGNIRCKLFLQFTDVIQPFLDSIVLDFYCYCLGSILASLTSYNTIFHDNFEDDNIELSPLKCSIAFELAKKVLFSVCEGESAENHLNKLKNELNINENDNINIISEDLILEFLINAFLIEESRSKEQIREQFEMDAAQYGGVITVGQFQTLTMFSSRKVDSKVYIEMMRDSLMKTSSKSISFENLIDSMHKNSLLVPISFDRIDYNIEDHLEDLFSFMKNEFNYRLPEILNKLEKAHKTDESLFKQLTAAKSKFEQVVETKRAGFFTEVAQRELYEKLKEIDLD